MSEDIYYKYEYECKCGNIFGSHRRMAILPSPCCNKPSRRYYGNHTGAYRQQSNNDATTKRN